MDALVIADLLGFRQGAGAAVDAAMHTTALDGIGRLRPLALHPFEIGEPRAILELVDHARRQIGLVRAQWRRREWKLGLFIHRGRHLLRDLSRGVWLNLGRDAVLVCSRFN